MAVLSKLYLIFQSDLNIMAFLKILFLKELLLCLQYFWFNGANLLSLKVKMVRNF